MKFLIISDLHGNISALEKLDGEFKAADAVLFGGDFAAFNHTETGLPALEALCKKHDVIFSVIGNCDEPEFLKELEKRDVSVENTLTYLGGVCIAGSGGGSKFTGTTPNERTEEELLSDFSVVEHASGGTGKKKRLEQSHPHLAQSAERHEMRCGKSRFACRFAKVP